MVAHPQPDSLNVHLRDVGPTMLREDCWRVVESDLYAMARDPVLIDPGGTDVEQEQRASTATARSCCVRCWYTGMGRSDPSWAPVSGTLSRSLDRDLVDRLRGVAPGQTGLAAHLGGERNR